MRWCTVTFRQEDYKRRPCVFTYRVTTNGIPGPYRCTNCGRRQ